jgi:serine/threonine-protein kinase RsbW
VGRAANVERTTHSSGTARFVELRQRIASRATEIQPLVDRLMGFIRLFMERFGIAKGTEDVIEIAICEALANAVIHGNQENTDKNVDVTCRGSTDGEVFIIVRDQGTGFDGSAVPDPTEPDRLLMTAGRGLHLMRTLMDEVSFEENGAVVRMRKTGENLASEALRGQPGVNG